jgi:pilus assembly protein CpaF
MRPDRLVVGEVRGAEVADLLAALNTGHEGGCGTVHANAPQDVPARLEALGMVGGLDRLAVHSQLKAALHVVIHLTRDSGGQRRVASVGVLERSADGTVVVADALSAPAAAGRPARRGSGWPVLQQLLDEHG